VSKPIVLAEYSNFIGINNLQDPRKLKPQELVKATNVDLTESGQLVTRKSPRKIFDGKVDSLFKSKNQGILCRINGDLVHLHNDLQTYDVILQDTKKPFKFVEHSHRIIATDGSEIGFIVAHKFTPFENPTDENRVKMPAGNYIELYHGRLYVAKNNTLYISDPLKFNQIQVPSGFIQFKSEITNLAAVDTGIYLSTTDTLYFLYGTKPEDFVLIDLGNIKVRPNGMGKIPTTYFGSETQVSQAVMYQQHTQSNIVIMFTTDGILAGLNNGKYLHLTNNRYGNLDYKQSVTIVDNKKVINII